MRRRLTWWIHCRSRQGRSTDVVYGRHGRRGYKAQSRASRGTARRGTISPDFLRPTPPSACRTCRPHWTTDGLYWTGLRQSSAFCNSERERHTSTHPAKNTEIQFFWTWTSHSSKPLPPKEPYDSWPIWKWNIYNSYWYQGMALRKGP